MFGDVPLLAVSLGGGVRSQSFPLAVVSRLVMVLSSYAIMRVSSIGVAVVRHDDSG